MKRFAYKISVFILGVILLPWLLLSCEGMTDNYQKYLEGGEIIYPGKVDSLKISPGKNRVELKWLVLSDPSITHFVVYWNNKKDSKVFPIDRVFGVQEVNVIVNDLPEGVYTFEVFSFDEDENRSVGREIVGTVYGDDYRKTLLNRAVNTIAFNENDEPVIKWGFKETGMLSEEIRYIAIGGEERLLIVDADESEVHLEDYDFNAQEGVLMLTVYKPAVNAIDTFHTVTEMVKVETKPIEKEEKVVDKSAFSLKILPGDYSEPNAATNYVQRIWQNNGVTENFSYISKLDGHVLPQFFTIDLGQLFELTKIRLYQRGGPSNTRRFYAGGNLRHFEIWGSVEPDAAYNPDDNGGSFGPTWKLLKTCYVDRPSGNIKPTAAQRDDNTSEDITAALGGHDFLFDQTHEVRYIRIKGIENWDSENRQFVNISSIDLWAMQ